MLTLWAVLLPCRWDSPYVAYVLRLHGVSPIYYSSSSSSPTGKGSDSSQNELISMAMAEASKLLDKSNLQDVVNGAAMTCHEARVHLVEATGGLDVYLMSLVSARILILEKFFGGSTCT